MLTPEAIVSKGSSGGDICLMGLEERRGVGVTVVEVHLTECRVLSQPEPTTRNDIRYFDTLPSLGRRLHLIVPRQDNIHTSQCE